MVKRRVIKVSKKDAKFKAKVQAAALSQIAAPVSIEQNTTVKKQITLPQVIQIRKLAEDLNQPINSIIELLLKNNILVTINQSVDFDTAAIIADELGYEAIPEEVERKMAQSISTGKLEIRPPVVAVMGHVDHGKTKLLDAIRNTNVVAGESGGITQHIGAYSVNVKIKDGKKEVIKSITFVDTPGHEAFSAMRAHGANITDLVVLVVAADDGVKPQTVEAISHARAAKVPIIVAVNKIDLPAADPERVKRELAEHNLVPEDWGGKTPIVELSAKENKGIDNLLELIALQSDLMDLKYSPDSPIANGVVIESHVEQGLGAVATLLVKDGIIKKSDQVVINSDIIKIRSIKNDKNANQDSVPAGKPALVSGFKQLPEVGQIFYATSDPDLAKEYASSREKQVGVSLASISKNAKEGGLTELNIILRADTQGSLQAISDSLGSIESNQVKISMLASGVGDVTEGDINLATTATNALVVSFNAAVPPAVTKLARLKNIKILKYSIIYELIDDVLSAVNGLLEPEIVETKVGQMKILKIFRHTPNEGIFGGLVTGGEIKPGQTAKIFRDDIQTAEVAVKSVHMGATEVDKAKENEECGVFYTGSAKLKAEDKVEFYLKEEILQKATIKRA